jgi:hypothetical protein
MNIAHMKMSQQYAENTCKNAQLQVHVKAPAAQAQVQAPAAQAPAVHVKAQAQAQAVHVQAKCDYYKYDCLNRGCHKGTCYRIDSTDTRCFGLCYCCCPAKNISRLVDTKRCDFCPESLAVHLESGYFKTIDGPDEGDNCFCTVLCLPMKFPLFLPCFLGSIFNDALNKWCCAFSNQDRNYIF